MYKKTKQEYLYTSCTLFARFVLSVQNIRSKKDPSLVNPGFRRKILLLLHLWEHTFLLHLLYLLAFLFFMLHHSSLRSVLLFATIFFDHFCHCFVCFGLRKGKKIVAYIWVEDNHRNSSAGPPKGNE